MMHEVLIEIFDTKRFLFPPDITSHELIAKHYQCFRTFRQLLDTRALEHGVNSSDVDVVNHWKKVETSKGKVPGHIMQQIYAQFDLLLEPFLRYTTAM